MCLRFRASCQAWAGTFELLLLSVTILSLGLSWSILGELLGPFRGFQGLQGDFWGGSWGSLGASWGRLGVLGCLGGLLGVSWVPLGDVWGASGGVLGSLGDLLVRLGCLLGRLLVRLGLESLCGMHEGLERPWASRALGPSLGASWAVEWMRV